MNKYDEKIRKIKDDRIKMLEMVKYNIIENKEYLSDSLNNVMKVLYLEEENSKKYEALVKAQNIIVDLTQKIVSTENVDDIINLRKKINYYINKIKKELKKRNISDETISNYQEKVDIIRKNYSKYLRYLKRKDNIDSIEKLFSNYSSLSDEEKKEFRRLIRNEKRYSKRNISFFNEFFDNYTCSEEEKKEDSNIIEKIELSGKSSSELDNSAEKIMIRNIDVPLDDDSMNNENDLDVNIIKSNTMSSEFKSFQDVDQYSALSYLYAKSEELKNKYGIVDTIDYGYSGIKNIFKFIKNIHNNIINTKIAKKMYSDFYGFYSGNDMISFYEYTIKRNSIRHGLKAILRPSHLYKKEDIYLRKRDNCVEWLYNFCKNNSLNFFVPKKYIKN